MMKLLECIQILERQKAAKIKYCQDRGLPIPTFDSADDYWIPVDPVPAKQYVEVVRCKDCEFRGDDDAVCPMRHYGGHIEDYTRDDGFCDRGKRKKTEAAE